MNWNEIVRHWDEARSDIQARWTKLSDDDLRAIDGNEDRLIAKIQDRYGMLEEHALVGVNEWLEKHSPPPEVRPYRLTVLAAVAIGLVLAGFTFVPLPWGPVKYLMVALLALALLGILFLRRRRLEF